jgi:hypothetical protein
VANALRKPSAAEFRLAEGLHWWDESARCTLVVSQPAVDSPLWSGYGQGAVESYRRHGVECALDHAALCTGADTAMFFVALDEAGAMLGGVRAKGPLRCADDSHAVAEWQGQAGQNAVRKMITDRLSYGVLEMKSAWVSDDPDRQGVTEALARSGFHMMALLDAQFCMATSAAYVLNRWRSSGGVIAPIPATPYPDPRYQTKLMWWDRHTFSRYAQPQQAARIWRETRAIAEKIRSGQIRRAGTAAGGPAGP